MKCVPWLVCGVVIGALLMRSWPGQDERGVALEMLRCCGTGFVIGLVLDRIFSRSERTAKAQDQMQHQAKPTDDIGAVRPN